MRITRIELPESDFKDGLGDISLTGLGSVVVLTGPNGAGKTRLLKRISAVGSWPRSRQAMEDLEREIAILRTHSQENSNFAYKSATRERHLRQARAIEVDMDRGFNAVPFVPRPGEMRDPRTVPPQELDEAISQARSPGCEGLSNIFSLVVQGIQQSFIDTTHSEVPPPGKVADIARERYERLKEYVSRFLNSTIGRDSSAHATLFGRPVHEAGLSQGQQVLLQLAIALSEQRKSLRNIILLLDEPENHLHPSALREFIDGVKDAAPECQLWIATHSVHVLAHVPPESIWFVDEGQVRRAGRVPELVLGRLLGSEEQQGELRDFLALPDRLALVRFAAECLLAPAAIDTSADDPQLQQIRGVVEEGIRDSMPLRVLDYGAGRGRLLGALAELLQSKNLTVAQFLDYYAIEPDEANASALEEVIARYYGEGLGRSRVFSDAFQIGLDDASVDFVVLVNTLHELPPSTWEETFCAHIAPLLKTDGELLIVEDHQIPYGEAAHAHGFLLLDDPELRNLFSIKEEDGCPRTIVDSRDRLKVHRIPARCVDRVTQHTRQAALETLRKRAKSEIAKIRREEACTSYRVGRVHALWLALFANASLALE